MELLPCPFCRGDAEIINLTEGENAGGSCVCCTRCQASGNVEFGRKENFVSNWNTRTGPVPSLDREWQPIETAPKDGTPFLATHIASGAINITWYGKTSHVPLYGWCEGDDPDDIDLWKPTHWMPLPASPGSGLMGEGEKDLGDSRSQPVCAPRYAAATETPLSDGEG